MYLFGIDHAAFLVSGCFCCFSNTFATLELAAVIEPLGIVIVSGPLASGKHSEQVAVHYIMLLHCEAL